MDDKGERDAEVTREANAEAQLKEPITKTEVTGEPYAPTLVGYIQRDTICENTN